MVAPKFSSLFRWFNDNIRLLWNACQPKKCGFSKTILKYLRCYKTLAHVTIFWSAKVTNLFWFAAWLHLFMDCYVKYVNLANGNAQLIERATRHQSSGSAQREWMYHRTCRMTSAFAKQVTTAMDNQRTGKELCRKNLDVRHIKPTDISQKPAIKRGKELEDVTAHFFLSWSSNTLFKYSWSVS